MVDVRADGSAHVNVAGRHVDYPAGDIAETRTAVIAYAADLARSMNRPVRMATSGPDGIWKLAVHPNGTVTDRAAENAKPKRRPRTVLEQPSAAAAGTTATIELTPALVPALVVERSDFVEAAPLMQRPPVAALPTATLTFSTGAVARIRAATLLGRRPATDGEKNTDELLAIDDDSSTISKTHARLEWQDDGLWITDRQSANGTIVDRPGQKPVELAADQSYQLSAGDIVRLGEVTFIVSMDEADQ
jgi:hypothetical protein